MFLIKTRHTLKYINDYVNKLGYILLNDSYKNAQTKLILKDYQGFYYIITYNNLLKGETPSKFAKHNIYTIDNIKLWLQINFLPYELISNNYIGVKNKLVFKDFDGFYYNTSLESLMLNKSLSKIAKSNPYTLQNIKLWCELNDKSFELLEDQEYKGSNKKLKWQCLKSECGEIFEMSWGNISIGRGCSFCGGKQVGISNCLATKNSKLASEWHPTLNEDLTPWDVTCNNGRNVWWQCDKGHEWEASISNRYSQHSDCPYCTGRKPSKEYNLLVCNPKLCEEWDYNKNKINPEEYCPNSGDKVWWICSKCGWEWYIQINQRNGVYKTGCPLCAESKGEKQLDYILSQYNVPHDSQYTFDDLRGIGGGLLKFDTPVFVNKEKTQLRILIEYDGKQHYEWVKGFYTKEDFLKLQYHDKLKNEYCKNNNISLLRIPYWDYDNIENILRKELCLSIIGRTV